MKPFSKEQINLTLNSPSSWLSKGLELYEVAKYLRPQIEQIYFNSKNKIIPKVSLDNTFMMLCGMAVENFMKGLTKNPLKYGHNIDALAKKLKIFTDEEMSCIKKMKHYIVWFGKYSTPKPKNAEDYEDLFKIGYFYIEDLDLIKNIVRKLLNKYEIEIEIIPPNQGNTSKKEIIGYLFKKDMIEDLL